MSFGMRKVLLLSQAYLPLRIISWQKAITLWALEKVDVVDSDPDTPLHSASRTIPLPTVVRLIEDGGARPFVMGTKLNRLSVYTRDNYTCQYCGTSHFGDRRNLTIDHILPRSRGGVTRWENIVTACAKCNRKKGGHTPKEAGMHLMGRPYRPNYLPEVICEVRRMGRVPVPWTAYLEVFLESA